MIRRRQHQRLSTRLFEKDKERIENTAGFANIIATTARTKCIKFIKKINRTTLINSIKNEP